MATNNLKIIADDLGLDESVNEGIFFALKKGLVSGASLMANGNAFNHAVNLIKSDPWVNIGIHLGLVEEKSLALPHEIPSLVDRTGSFPASYRHFFIKYVLGRINKSEIEREYEAQIKKCLDNGIKLNFMNSHQHLHLLPAISGIMVKLAKKYRIPYIRTVNGPFQSQGGVFRKAQLAILRLLSKIAKNKIRKSGLETNDYFVGFINAGNLSSADIKLAIKLKNKKPDLTIELGCHPGFENDELRGKYHHWDYHWENDLKTLKETLI